MSLVGFKARNHPQQVGAAGIDTNTDNRATPPEVFADFHRRFNFTVDAAAMTHNAKLPRFFSPEQNGVEQDWTGERVWCNPPYSTIEPWIIKARGSGADLVVFLLPANRTEQVWWQRHIEPFRDRQKGLTVEFLPGRMRFIAPYADDIKPNERPPFGVCLLIFEGEATRNPYDPPQLQLDVIATRATAESEATHDAETPKASIENPSQNNPEDSA